MLSLFFKPDQRNGVGYARIVGIEGNDVGHAVLLQFLQSKGAIQAFAGGTLVLPALVQHRHDNVDALGFAADSGDDALQILEVVVGGHGHFHAVHVKGFVVGAYVDDDVDVVPAHAFFDDALAFAGAEAGAVRLDQEGVTVEPRHRVEFFVLGFLEGVPFFQPSVDLVAHFLAARHGDQAKRPHGNALQIPLCQKTVHTAAPLYQNMRW